jgi:hypothetical protein
MQPISKTGGQLFCEDRGDRATKAGRAILYLEGPATIQQNVQSFDEASSYPQTSPEQADSHTMSNWMLSLLSLLLSYCYR